MLHQSEQMEAGSARRVECEIQVIALGEGARWLQAVSLGTAMQIKGFLAARSRNSRQLRLHATTIEFVEGREDGTIFQEEG